MGLPGPGSLDADLAVALDAALAGGAEARARFGAPLDVREKSPNNPVTDADLAVDAILHRLLGAARPDYAWLSEESHDDRSRLSGRPVWVVDPIDGTRAFIRGKPHFSVCVGLVVEGAAVAGVVHNPVTGETFAARLGGGATLNGAPIRPAPTARIEACRMLGDAHMFGHPAWPRPWPPMQIEQRNSIAYRMCLVAAGQFDAAIALSAKSDWDLAAADIIVAEAGGLATAHDGARFRYDGAEPRQKSLVVAGSLLHPLLIERVAHIHLP